MARGLWAAFSIVVGVISFAVVASSESVMTRALSVVLGLAPGSLQLGAYGTLALAAVAFAIAIFVFLILVPELTDIARLDGVLRGLRGLHPLHEGSPKLLLRELDTSPALAHAASALTPSLRLQAPGDETGATLVSDIDAHPLIAAAPLDTPPRAHFFRAVLALLALAGITLALLNSAAPQTAVGSSDGVTAAMIGTVVLACVPFAVAILLWAGHELLRDITRLQLRLVQDELRDLIVVSRPASDGAALRDTLREEMTKLQQGLADFLEVIVRRIDAIPTPAPTDVQASLGELPQIAGALKELREELTATVQVARDATKLLFSSAQHIEDIANLMRNGAMPAPAAASTPFVAASPAPTDEVTGDLRRAIGELLAETSEQATRLPKF